jgi:hypothetical protein
VAAAGASESGGGGSVSARERFQAQLAALQTNRVVRVRYDKWVNEDLAASASEEGGGGGGTAGRKYVEEGARLQYGDDVLSVSRDPRRLRRGEAETVLLYNNSVVASYTFGGSASQAMNIPESKTATWGTGTGTGTGSGTVTTGSGGSGSGGSTGPRPSAVGGAGAAGAGASSRTSVSQTAGAAGAAGTGSGTFTASSRAAAGAAGGVTSSPGGTIHPVRDPSQAPGGGGLSTWSEAQHFIRRLLGDLVRSSFASACSVLRSHICFLVSCVAAGFARARAHVASPAGEA